MTQALVNQVAIQKLAEVETLVGQLSNAENELEKGYAHLAFLLKEVSEKRYWEGEHESFGDYLGHLSQTYNLGKSQLYSYLSTARDLNGDVTEAQLNSMGISKALAVRGQKNATGSISGTVMEAALDPQVTVRDIKKLIFEETNAAPTEDSAWMDLDMSCYVSDEERREIQDAANAARHLDPPINDELKTHQVRKEILLRFAREFLGQYSDAIIEGGRNL